jgi:phage-related protein
MNFLVQNGINVANISNLATMFQEQIMSLIQNTVSFAGSIVEQIFAFVTIFTIALFYQLKTVSY